MTLSLFDNLRPGRLHEACGPGGDRVAARVFAAALAGGREGTVFWILRRPARELAAGGSEEAGLCPHGLAPLLAPGRLILACCATPLEVLWTAEEALRAGAAPTVIAELSGAVGLTASRRLQLAAEAGGALGLCLVPEGRAANAAESRWRCAARPPEAGGRPSWGRRSWRWECFRNKSGGVGVWDVAWDEEADRIVVVSPLLGGTPVPDAGGKSGGGSLGRRRRGEIRLAALLAR